MEDVRDDLYTGVYSIYDKVAEEYGPLFEAKNDAVAVRSCLLSIKSVNNPDDFILVHLAKCNHNTGVIVVNEYMRRVNFTFIKSPEEKYSITEVNVNESQSI